MLGSTEDGVKYKASHDRDEDRCARLIAVGNGVKEIVRDQEKQNERRDQREAGVAQGRFRRTAGNKAGP